MIPPDQLDPSSGGSRRQPPNATLPCNPPSENDDGNGRNGATRCNGTSDEKEKKRYRLQQSTLRLQRFHLLQQLETYSPDYELIENLYKNQIVGRLHEAPWDQVGSLFIKLDQTKLPVKGGTIVLGGWKHEAPSGMEDDLVEVPSRINEPLLHLQILHSIEKIISNNFSAATKQIQDEVKLLSVVRENEILFQEQFDPYKFQRMDCSMRIDSFLEIVLRKKKITILNLQTEFAYLEHKGFVFTPEEVDPLRGWNDFIQFCACYGCLPIGIRKGLEPYYFHIQLAGS